MKDALDAHIAEEMWGKQIVFDSHLTGVARRLEGWLVFSNGMWQELWERDGDLLFRNILKLHWFSDHADRSVNYEIIWYEHNSPISRKVLMLGFC